MNVIEQARMAYSPAVTAIRSPRSTEHYLFGKITNRIRQTMEALPRDYSDFVLALHENRKLWSALAVDVASEENALPQPLKEQIFYLAEFTRQHTGKVLRRKASAEVLIEINRAVMTGLSGQGAIE